MDARTYLIDSCVVSPHQQVPGPPRPLRLEAPPQTTLQRSQSSLGLLTNEHAGTSVSTKHTDIYSFIYFLLNGHHLHLYITGQKKVRGKMIREKKSRSGAKVHIHTKPLFPQFPFNIKLILLLS
jgi:hypothetical protein